MDNFALLNNYSYEEYQVKTVLEKLVSDEENLRPKEVDGFLLPPDFYVRNGIPQLKLDGKTVVEVKKTLSIASLKAIESLFDTQSQNGYNLLVVYFNLSLSNKPDGKTSNGKKLLLYSFDELKRIAKVRIKSEEDYYIDKGKNLDWTKAREKHIAKAKEIVKQGNVAMFLGAGVSMSANMPSWGKLLKGLMAEIKTLKGDSLKAFTELYPHVYSECGDSNLIMARYLETAVQIGSDSAEFTKLIHKYLYDGEHTSKLLSDLALIIKYHKTDEVITYNFDDILEQELVKVGLKESKDFVPIASDAEISDHNNLPIYHVHGIIPEHSNTSDRVVFSEEVYHERYRDTYHWSNVEQLHAMSRKHCFFIGLSMVDPNLRRLLDISRKMNATDTPSHYAFLKRTKQNDYCLSNNKGCQYVQVSQSLIDKKKQKDIYNLNYMVLENIFRQLGVNVIWYENHDEIPHLIEEIFDITITENQTKEVLSKDIETAIQRINKIESNIPKYDFEKNDIGSYLNFLRYTKSYGKEYMLLVSECGDMLTELSNKVHFETPKEVKDFINNMSKLDILGGYGHFFKMWFDGIKDYLGDSNKTDDSGSK